MADYDPEIIQEYATSLEKQAKSIVPAYFFIGIFLGLFLFDTISLFMTNTIDFLISAIGVLIGGVLGYGTGKYRALELRIQAQMTLCQMKIEQNTRG